MQSTEKLTILKLALLSLSAVLLGYWIAPTQAGSLFQSPISPLTTPTVISGRTAPIIFSLTPFPPTPTPTRWPDTTPPETTITLAGQQGQGNWYRTPVTVSFTAQDTGVGMGIIWYKLNAASEFDRVQEPGRDLWSPITVTQEGINDLSYYATDSYGNTELTQTTSIKIDLTPPTVTHTLSGDTLPPNWHLTPTTLNLIGQDNLSGIDFYEVNLDDSGWLTSTANYTLTVTGLHTVTYRATDLAGNVSHTNSFSLYLMHPPIVAEAEDFDATQPRNGQAWPILTHLSDFGGTGYVTASPDRGVLYNDSNLPSTAPELQYDLTLPFTRTYYLWLRGAGADAEGDEVYLALVEQGLTPTTPLSLSGLPPFRWGWSQVDLSGNPITVTVTTTGSHTLHLWPQEDGVSVDRILLTDNPEFVPTGVGP